MIVEHRFAHIVQEEARRQAWIDSHVPLTDVILGDGAVPPGAFHRYHHVGGAILGTFSAPAQTTVRTEGLALAQSLDHIVLRALTSGRARIQGGDEGGLAGPGDIIVLDLTRPVRIEADPASGFDLFLPRRTHIGTGDGFVVTHGRILAADGHPLTRMMADHLRGLTACLSASPPVLTADLMQATLVLCRMLLTSTATQEDAARPTLDRIAMRRFVEKNLATVDIPVLMARFGLSRTLLYQRFGARDGVAAYIRDRRLSAAMRAFSGAGRRPKIARLAHECGFTNPRAFSRAFHRKYGLWPAEAASTERRPGTDSSDTVLMAWLRDL